MTYEDLTVLQIDINDGVAHATIDNPPVNVIDVALVKDLRAFADQVADDPDVRVIVWQSAIPEYFSAHADFGWMWAPESLMELADPDGDARLNPLEQLHERLRTMPQVTIAKLRGRASAGGAELAMTADMRFAAAGETWLSQLESRLGIFPGGGGTQYLTRLVGRSRTLEVILSGDVYDTDLAERYGWINRAIDPSELDAHVDGLARRIASLPSGVAAAAKQAIDAAEASGGVPHVPDEAIAHEQVYPSPPELVERVRIAMDRGAQTRDGELEIGTLLDAIPWDPASSVVATSSEPTDRPVVSVERVDLLFTYRVKDGMDERFEEYLAAVPPTTEAREPYVLEYELFRRDDGSFLQHERYENEAAMQKHLEVTADGQVAWGEATELLSLTVIGKVSDGYWKQFDGWDGPDPVHYNRFREIAR